MQMTVLEDKKRRMVFELKEADAGLCTAIEKELWNDDAVTLASFTIDHPMVGVPKFTIETNTDREPKEALKKALARLKKQAEQFKDEVKGLK